MITMNEPTPCTTTSVRWVVWFWGVNRGGWGGNQWRTWRGYDTGPSEALRAAKKDARLRQPDAWPWPTRWKVMKVTTITLMEEAPCP